MLKFTKVLLSLLFLLCVTEVLNAQMTAVEIRASEQIPLRQTLRIELSNTEITQAKLFLGDSIRTSFWDFPAVDFDSASSEDCVYRRVPSSRDGRIAIEFSITRTSKAEWFGLMLNGDCYFAPRDLSYRGPVERSSNSSCPPLRGLSTVKELTWRPETKRKILESSVLIQTAKTGRSGTIIETPKGLENLLHEGEVLVLTAAHGLDDSISDREIFVTTFSYDDKLQAAPRKKYSARLLLGTDRDDRVDIGYLAIVDDGNLAKVSVASPTRWYTSECEYFQVGCPKGLPEFGLKPLIQAQRGDTPSVSIIQESEKGSSGGGLFDPDGYLVGLRVVRDEKPTELFVGGELFGRPFVTDEVRSGVSTIFLHPSLGIENVPVLVWDRANKEFESCLQALPPRKRTTLRERFRRLLGPRPNRRF